MEFAREFQRGGAEEREKCREKKKAARLSGLRNTYPERDTNF